MIVARDLMAERKSKEYGDYIAEVGIVRQSRLPLLTR
jgi:hypothetical protein